MHVQYYYQPHPTLIPNAISQYNPHYLTPSLHFTQACSLQSTFSRLPLAYILSLVCSQKSAVRTLRFTQTGSIYSDRIIFTAWAVNYSWLGLPKFVREKAILKRFIFVPNFVFPLIFKENQFDKKSSIFS